MSDESRPIMQVIGTNTEGAYCAMCGRGVCRHTAAGITELIRMTNDPPPERAILTDLIAELRAMPAACDVCCDVPGELAADRAEARLREVGGDE